MLSAMSVRIHEPQNTKQHPTQPTQPKQPEQPVAVFMPSAPTRSNFYVVCPVGSHTRTTQHETTPPTHTHTHTHAHTKRNRLCHKYMMSFLQSTYLQIAYFFLCVCACVCVCVCKSVGGRRHKNRSFNGTMYHFHDDTKKNTSPINTRFRFYTSSIYKSPISFPLLGLCTEIRWGADGIKTEASTELSHHYKKLIIMILLFMSPVNILITNKLAQMSIAIP